MITILKALFFICCYWFVFWSSLILAHFMGFLTLPISLSFFYAILLFPLFVTWFFGFAFFECKNSQAKKLQEQEKKANDLRWKFMTLSQPNTKERNFYLHTLDVALDFDTIKTLINSISRAKFCNLVVSAEIEHINSYNLERKTLVKCDDMKVEAFFAKLDSLKDEKMPTVVKMIVKSSI